MLHMVCSVHIDYNFPFIDIKNRQLLYYIYYSYIPYNGIIHVNYQGFATDEIIITFVSGKS